MASQIGWYTGQVSDSRQWVNASIPVAAVRDGGRLTVSSGSRIALLGISHGLKMMILRLSFCDVITDDLPTSLPVPAVVGIAMIGSYGPVRRSMPPAWASKSASVPSPRAMTTV